MDRAIQESLREISQVLKEMRGGGSGGMGGYRSFSGFVHDGESISSNGYDEVEGFSKAISKARKQLERESGKMDAFLTGISSGQGALQRFVDSLQISKEATREFNNSIENQSEGYKKSANAMSDFVQSAGVSSNKVKSVSESFDKVAEATKKLQDKIKDRTTVEERISSRSKNILGQQIKINENLSNVPDSIKLVKDSIDRIKKDLKSDDLEDKKKVELDADLKGLEDLLGDLKHMKAVRDAASDLRRTVKELDAKDIDGPEIIELIEEFKEDASKHNKNLLSGLDGMTDRLAGAQKGLKMQMALDTSKQLASARSTNNILNELGRNLRVGLTDFAVRESGMFAERQRRVGIQGMHSYIPAIGLGMSESDLLKIRDEQGDVLRRMAINVEGHSDSDAFIHSDLYRTDIHDLGKMLGRTGLEGTQTMLRIADSLRVLGHDMSTESLQSMTKFVLESQDKFRIPQDEIIDAFAEMTQSGYMALRARGLDEHEILDVLQEEVTTRMRLSRVMNQDLKLQQERVRQMAGYMMQSPAELLKTQIAFDMLADDLDFSEDDKSLIRRRVGNETMTPEEARRAEELFERLAVGAADKRTAAFAAGEPFDVVLVDYLMRMAGLNIADETGRAQRLTEQSEEWANQLTESTRGASGELGLLAESAMQVREFFTGIMESSGGRTMAALSSGFGSLATSMLGSAIGSAIAVGLTKTTTIAAIKGMGAKFAAAAGVGLLKFAGPIGIAIGTGAAGYKLGEGLSKLWEDRSPETYNRFQSSLTTIGDLLTGNTDNLRLMRDAEEDPNRLFSWYRNMMLKGDDIKTSRQLSREMRPHEQKISELEEILVEKPDDISVKHALAEARKELLDLQIRTISDLPADSERLQTHRDLLQQRRELNEELENLSGALEEAAGEILGMTHNLGVDSRNAVEVIRHGEPVDINALDGVQLQIVADRLFPYIESADHLYDDSDSILADIHSSLRLHDNMRMRVSDDGMLERVDRDTEQVLQNYGNFELFKEHMTTVVSRSADLGAATWPPSGDHSPYPDRPSFRNQRTHVRGVPRVLPERELLESKYDAYVQDVLDVKGEMFHGMETFSDNIGSFIATNFSSPRRGLETPATLMEILGRIKAEEPDLHAAMTQYRQEIGGLTLPTAFIALERFQDEINKALGEGSISIKPKPVFDAPSSSDTLLTKEQVNALIPLEGIRFDTPVHVDIDESTLIEALSGIDTESAMGTRRERVGEFNIPDLKEVAPDLHDRVEQYRQKLIDEDATLWGKISATAKTLHHFRNEIDDAMENEVIKVRSIDPPIEDDTPAHMDIDESTPIEALSGIDTEGAMGTRRERVWEFNIPDLKEAAPDLHDRVEQYRQKLIDEDGTPWGKISATTKTLHHFRNEINDVMEDEVIKVRSIDPPIEDATPQASINVDNILDNNLEQLASYFSRMGDDDFHSYMSADDMSKMVDDLRLVDDRSEEKEEFLERLVAIVEKVEGNTERAADAGEKQVSRQESLLAMAREEYWEDRLAGITDSINQLDRKFAAPA